MGGLGGATTGPYTTRRGRGIRQLGRANKGGRRGRTLLGEGDGRKHGTVQYRWGAGGGGNTAVHDIAGRELGNVGGKRGAATWLYTPKDGRNAATKTSKEEVG